MIEFKDSFYIAFFNYRPGDVSKKELLDEYKKKYHVIIQNDGNLEFVNDFLKSIFINTV